MLVPLKDDKPLEFIPFQLVTAAIVAVCVVTFAFQASLGPRAEAAFVYGFGLIPSVLWGDRALADELFVLPAWLNLFTSMFLHGSWWHLLGNMLFLWVFGDNVEDATGHVKFLIFYLLCGIAGTLAHAALAPGSDAPMIGASGAISGVIGAYLLLHPRAKVWCLVFFKIPLKLPSVLLIGGWIGFQFYNVVVATDDGTAWWAHVGGLAAGVILIPFLKHREVRLFGRGTAPDEPLVAREPATKRPDRSRIPDSGGRRDPWRKP